MAAAFRLRLITPTQVVLDEEVVSVVAEDASGSFGVLAHHERLVAALVPTIIRCQTRAGQVKYVAVDRGLLRKEGPELRIAARQAVVGDDYRRLEELIVERLTRLEESEARARSAFSRISLSVMLRLFGYERGGR
jgi:F-type H+-transporting ATPase subunit epsilon